MNIYQKKSSDAWHIDTPNGCGKRDGDGNSRRGVQLHKEIQSQTWRRAEERLRGRAQSGPLLLQHFHRL